MEEPQTGPLLLAVPNVSEGRDHGVLESIERRLAPARFLDLHVDPDHNRSVFTIAGRQGELAPALLGIAGAALEGIDLSGHDGLHPYVGALDVAPVVYLDEDARGAACAEALTAAALVGEELELPVFLYGQLATRAEHVERAQLRRGGPRELAARMAAGELAPDYGPAAPHPTAGAVLVTARPPLIAFNLDLETDDVEVAIAIAASLRESGGGRPACARWGSSFPSAAVRRCPRTCTTTGRRRSRRSWRACAPRPPWPRRSWWVSRRARRSRDSPTTCRCAASRLSVT